MQKYLTCRPSISKPLIWLLLVFLGFVSQRCANPVMPQGGPKDTTPPKLLHASPPNYSTHFSADRFYLTFDEFLSLREINKQFLVSPPMAKTPLFKLRKRTLEVRFEDSLRTNTTYSLYFGDAITDLNENNPVSDFQYVFATGSALDSLELSGQVLNAFNLKPVENAFAMLYDAGNDSLAVEEMPLYFPPVYIAKTDKNGTFTLRNLRNENYLLITLKDANGNYFFDQPNEEIAFFDTPVLAYYKGLKTDSTAAGPPDSLAVDTIATKSWQLVSKRAEYKLYSFLEADTVQRLLKKELLSSYHLSLQFKLPVSGFRLQLIPPSDTLYRPVPDFNKAGDSLSFWFPDYTSDSIHLVVSADGILNDTLAMPVQKVAAKNPRTAAKPETLGLRLPTGQADAFKPLTLAFNRPVKSANNDSLLLIENSDTLAVTFRFADSLRKRIIIAHALQFGASYLLVIPGGTFTDILGFVNDSTPARFNTRQADAYGTLKMNVRPPTDGQVCLIQMMDEKENLIRQDRINGLTTLDYGRLLPRKLRFKAILDSNDNGKWDSGNYRRKVQPEKVQYFGSTVEIRANWDLTEEWNLE